MRVEVNDRELRKLIEQFARQIDAVLASHSDVTSDTQDPTFAFGHGLQYGNWVAAVAPERDDAAEDTSGGARWDLDRSPIGDMLDDPETRDIISLHVPELVGNPMMAMAKILSLNAVLGMAASSVSEEAITQFKSEIAAL